MSPFDLEYLLHCQVDFSASPRPRASSKGSRHSVELRYGQLGLAQHLQGFKAIGSQARLVLQ